MKHIGPLDFVKNMLWSIILDFLEHNVSLVLYFFETIMIRIRWLIVTLQVKNQNFTAS